MASMAGLVRGLPSFLTIVTCYVSRPKNLEDLHQSEITKLTLPGFSVKLQDAQRQPISEKEM